MKILVAGVSGFIGSKLYNLLSKKNEVFGVSYPKANFPNCTELNLLSKEDTIEYFEKNKFDVIINLVSIMAKQETAKKYSFFAKNLKIQENILEASKYFTESIFVNFSSSAVYPNITGLFSENDKIDPSYNPDCLYGLAKFNSEILFKFLFPSQVKLLNLRIGHVYGEGMDETRIHKVFEKELKDENTITVFGNGERVVPQIEVESLCNKINELIFKGCSGTYNLADENILLTDLAKRIIKETGNSESKLITLNKGNKNQFRLDTSKMSNL